MYSLLLLVVAFGSVLSFPTQPPGSGNIPRCAQPAVGGMCLAYFPSYFFNPSSGRCERFIYGGCQGNENRFFSEEECMEVCGGFKIETYLFELQTEGVQPLVDSSESDSSEESKPSEEQEQPAAISESETGAEAVQPEDSKGDESETDPCKMPQAPGLCYAYMPRYFFNGAECVQFIYGGCQGNENNFFTLDACRQRCQPGTTQGSESDGSEPRSEDETSPSTESDAAPSSAEDASPAESSSRSEDEASPSPKSDAAPPSTEAASPAESSSIAEAESSASSEAPQKSEESSEA